MEAALADERRRRREMEAALADERRRRREVEAALAAASEDAKALRASASWRLTAPLRRLHALLNRRRGRGA